MPSSRRACTDKPDHGLFVVNVHNHLAITSVLATFQPQSSQSSQSTYGDDPKAGNPRIKITGSKVYERNGVGVVVLTEGDEETIANFKKLMD